MPRWLAKVLRNWHLRRANQLGAIAEDRRKHLQEILERTAHQNTEQSIGTLSLIDAATERPYEDGRSG